MAGRAVERNDAAGRADGLEAGVRAAEAAVVLRRWTRQRVRGSSPSSGAVRSAGSGSAVAPAAASVSYVRSIWNAPPICLLSSTPFFHISASSIASCAGLMNTESSPGSLKSVCAANIVTGCYNSEFFPDEPLCDLITRSTTGAAALNITGVENPYINVANQRNTGIDLTAQFRQDLGSWGTLSLLAQMTWQISDTQELFPGNETVINGEAGEPVWVGDLHSGIDL